MPLKGRRGRVAKHSGKGPWFANHHLDLDYQGPAEVWIQKQAVPRLGAQAPRAKVAAASAQAEAKRAAAADGNERRCGPPLDLGEGWPSLSRAEKNTGLSCPGSGAVTVVAGAERMLVVAAHNEDEWVYLSPKPLYSDALRSESDVASVASKGSGASKWLLVDEDDDATVASMGSDCMSVSYVEEEVVIGDDAPFETYAGSGPPTSKPRASGRRQLFFEDY